MSADPEVRAPQARQARPHRHRHRHSHRAGHQAAGAQAQSYVIDSRTSGAGGPQRHRPHQSIGYALDRIPIVEKYAYCLCLHVKPTTIFIGVFKLIRALLFASISLSSEFSAHEQANHGLHPSSGPSPGLAGGGGASHALDERNRSTEAAVNILTRVLTASVSAVGVYSVISGRAALLMPLYAMMLVDFFFNLPAFYSRDLDSAFADNWLLDSGAGRSHASGLLYPQPATTSASATANHTAEQYARYSLMLISTIVMIVEVYFLCVVWKCYRYLRIIELVQHISQPVLQARLGQHHNSSHHNQHNSPHAPHPLLSVLAAAAAAGEHQFDARSSLAPPPYESVASAANAKPPNYEEAIKSAPPSSVVFSVDALIEMQRRTEAEAGAASVRQANNDQQQAPPQYAVGVQPAPTTTAAPDDDTSHTNQTAAAVDPTGNHPPGNQDTDCIIIWFQNMNQSSGEQQQAGRELAPSQQVAEARSDGQTSSGPAQILSMSQPNSGSLPENRQQ